MDKLLFLFVLLPLVELALLTTLSHYTSLPTTILFIVITGLLGTWMARVQGMHTYRRIQEELSAGRMPRDSMVDGVLILVGGILLITPGVLTDIFGILLMFPLTRRFFRIWLIRWFALHVQVRTFQPNNPNSPHARTSGDSSVVDTYATERESTTTRPGIDASEESPGV